MKGNSMEKRKLKGTDPKSAKPRKPKMLIFGAAGAGKTWGALDFPSVYYVDSEDGASLGHYTDKLKASGGLYLGVDQGSNDFDTIVEEVITLATTPHKYRTFVHDSYSKTFNTAITVEFERLEKAGRDMDKTFGAEKKKAINYTRKMIHWFEKLDMNAILVCHEKALWKDGKETGVTFDGWDKLAYELDLVLRIVKTGPSRRALVVKSRLAQFAEGESFEWSYAAFAAKYGKDIMEAEAEAVALATPEQLAQYAALLDTIKVDAKVLERWDETVDDVAELTAPDMQARIDYLEKQRSKAQGAKDAV